MKVNWKERLAKASAFTSIVNTIDLEDFLKLSYKEKVKILRLYENKYAYYKQPKDKIKQCPTKDTCELIDSFLEKELTNAELWENYRKMKNDIIKKEKFIIDWKDYIIRMEEDLLALEKAKNELFDTLLKIPINWDTPDN